LTEDKNWGIVGSLQNVIVLVSDLQNISSYVAKEDKYVSKGKCSNDN